ncbi:hypothetical protein HYPSUDRAFT_208164 [Hypholoma sublateritium FD-334 SS-4]|uniref:Uncharacterized protein n=1 Tax=Hypholoma sublateritium (strain FD-334 SS-4) TaxID=945553 RepID=A0A0D2LW83_HYPSF|nr:hypothetical protein HYPSUDRAFT_208164 [Hypholoma sublateritium FD-334 SS-4]
MEHRAIRIHAALAATPSDLHHRLSKEKLRPMSRLPTPSMPASMSPADNNAAPLFAVFVDAPGSPHRQSPPSIVVAATSDANAICACRRAAHRRRRYKLTDPRPLELSLSPARRPHPLPPPLSARRPFPDAHPDKNVRMAHRAAPAHTSIAVSRSPPRLEPPPPHTHHTALMHRRPPILPPTRTAGPSRSRFGAQSASPTCAPHGLVGAAAAAPPSPPTGCHGHGQAVIKHAPSLGMLGHDAAAGYPRAPYTALRRCLHRRLHRQRRFRRWTGPLLSVLQVCAQAVSPRCGGRRCTPPMLIAASSKIDPRAIARYIAHEGTRTSFEAPSLARPHHETAHLRLRGHHASLGAFSRPSTPLHGLSKSPQCITTTVPQSGTYRRRPSTLVPASVLASRRRCSGIGKEAPCSIFHVVSAFNQCPHCTAGQSFPAPPRIEDVGTSSAPR